MTEPALTDRQRQILALIRRHVRETGFPPTRAEIAAACGFRSVNAAVDHLKALARRGVIELKPGRSRGIRLLEPATSVPDAYHARAGASSGSAVSAAPADSTHNDSMHNDSIRNHTQQASMQALPLGAWDVPMGASWGLPLVGRVAAGRPLLAVEHIEDYYPVDSGLFRPRADYLLRVSGESMRDAGILDGDLLAVQRTVEAKNGQIVVVRLDDEVTVKRFHQSRDHPHQVRLLPANAGFDPIEVDLRMQELTVEGRGVGVLRPRLALA